MPFDIRPAVRQDVDLWIGLAGGTGSGKTYTGMRLASGLAQALGLEKFLVVDTENGRALHYADFFTFDHLRFDPPYSPLRYAEAIEQGAKSGYRVILADSMTHEWAGQGGVLDMQEEAHKRLGGGENTKLLSWSVKQQHKEMRDRMLLVHAHLVLCFRAEDKIEMAKDGNRTVVRAKEGPTGTRGWFPVTEKAFPFELTTFHMLLASAPGVPVPVKLQEQHKYLFPADQPITEETGIKLAEWARGAQINWLERIERTTTKGELVAVGRQIATIKSTLPESAREILAGAYDERLKQLSQPEKRSA